MKNKIWLLPVFILIISNIIFTTLNAYANPNTIVIVKSSNLENYNEIISSFELSSGKLSDYKIQIIDGQGDVAKLESILNELKGKPDNALIITIGIQATFMAQNIIKNIPIIFCAVYDWKKYIKLDGTITGIEMENDYPSIFHNIKLISSNFKNVGLIYDPQFSEEQVEELMKFETSQNISVMKSQVKAKKEKQITIKDLKKCFSYLSGKIDMLYLFPDPTIINQENFDFILEKCKELNIPLFTYNEEFVKKGALASISPDYSNIGSQLALISRQLLLNKKTPDTMEISKPIGSLFVVNFSTAEALKLNINFLKKIINKTYY